MTGETIEHAPWRERAMFLPAAGALFGLAFYLLVDRGETGVGWTEDRLRIAAASAVIVSGIAFALTIERVRWAWSIIFSVVVGLVAGGVFYWNGGPSGYRGDQWQVIAALVAIAIAAPVFQAARDHGRWSDDYASAHSHAWGNAVLAGVGVLFAGISFLLSQLLGELFSLIGLDGVQRLVRKEWFGWVIAGAAFGGAVAILRARDRVLGILQHIVMTILSVLAPVLAVGLTLFIASLPFTGLEPLWDRTSATTPVLLACVIGAVLLANAIIGNSAEEESKVRVLRVSALLLCLAVLPLTAVAFTSTWLRVEQHGFTPERLWALVFVGVALAAGIAYALAVVIGRQDWMATLRRVNLQLALGVCAVAFLLALPLINFGAISTRNQIARLESGKIAPEQFDWAALAFDFGPSGKAAARRYASQASTPALRQEARRALAAKTRWELGEATFRTPNQPLANRLRVRPAKVSIPATLQAALGRPSVCGSDGKCDLFWSPGQTQAVAVHDLCAPTPHGRDGESTRCDIDTTVLVERDGEWHEIDEVRQSIIAEMNRYGAQQQRDRRAAVARGEVEVREVTLRQLYIGGKPSGEPFE